jgi:BirA family transcriptional regulator, biotin operon repressor / biotin---[acetyl-CoA-carboxylase] ligase
MHEHPRQDTLSPAPLDTARVGSRVLVYDSVGSTNELALRTRGDGVVVVAENQTRGRGRHGRQWASPPGLGIWCSVAFDGPLDGLPFAGALALRDALCELCDVRVKWPNDLLAGGRKLCGLLVEGRADRVVLGFGLNVGHAAEDFPEELRDRATSLRIETGKLIARGPLLRRILTMLDARVAALDSGGFDRLWSEWTEACGMRGRRVRVGGVDGAVSGLDATGALLVDTVDGRRRVAYGDVAELTA